MTFTVTSIHRYSMRYKINGIFNNNRKIRKRKKRFQTIRKLTYQSYLITLTNFVAFVPAKFGGLWFVYEF